jgi:hypothetical protein
MRHRHSAGQIDVVSWWKAFVRSIRRTALPNQTVPGVPAATAESAISWAPASSPILQGDAQISIKMVKVGKVRLKGFGDETSSSADDLLMIDIGVANQSPTRKLDYKTWAGAEFNLGRDFATLTDNFGNVYKRTTFGMDKPEAAEFQSRYPALRILNPVGFLREIGA